MSDVHPPDLESLVRDELSTSAPEAVGPWLAEIQARYGGSLAALLFYGSCLRRPHEDGVLDFYAIVDDYGAAYGSRALALANALLPPNVFYLEGDGGRERDGCRAKVAVLSSRDFARAVSLSAIRPGVWARFCQPFAIAWCRDGAARDAVVASAATAIRTAVTRGLGLCTAAEPTQALWSGLFHETYRSELRTERADAVKDLFEAATERYERVTSAALRELAPLDALYGRPRRDRRVLGKAIGVLQLLKSAATFGDWMPYALWKLERHTGTRLEPTERQRRHPFLFGWPLFFRVLARKELR